jgi:anthranilate synthase
VAASEFVQASAPLAWVEPLAAYRSLRGAGLGPLLLDGLGAHPDARWAFIALDEEVEVRFEGGAVTKRWRNGALDASTEPPLEVVRTMGDMFRFATPEHAPFTGGWIGYFGFGFARAIEPSLAAVAAPAPRVDETPDAILRLCKTVLAFDRDARTAVVYSADLDGNARAASRRANEIALLVTALPKFEPPAPASPAPMGWTPSLDQASFEKAVTTLREHIHGGDLFQANLATRFTAPTRADPADLFGQLQAANPSPFMALLEFSDFAIVSGSPEQLFRVSGGVISSRPIAGTRKRGGSAEADLAMEEELRTNEKEQAEHTMLVDLVRNDVARVSLPGTTRVAERGSVERYRHVMHLASRVEGKLRPGTNLADWLAALFPGGTVTGAPKVRAMQRILELEPVARGPYTGSAGYLSWSGNAQWNIMIRGITMRDGNASVHGGSGIVADSDPTAEWREANRKAQAILEAATGRGGTTGNPTRLGEVTRHGTWEPPHARTNHARARVLLVDNFDSFVYNLADYAAALGATTSVVRNDADWRSAFGSFRPTHVILSPGPGWPDEAGCTLEMARELSGVIPILGVCLGHQAIAQAHGGVVRVHPKGPVHGKSAFVHHAGAGLMAGLPTPLAAGRYHSLIVEGESLPADWVVDARLEDGTVMAIRHTRHPTHGLQFHPESLCTPLGLELLDRFLRVSP